MSTLNDPTEVDAIDTINDLSKGVPSHARDNLERRLLRKLDLRMSILLILQTLNLIDRSNISNARLQGFEKDLHLHGQQYATTLSILYVGYIVMQVPGNMFLHWLEKPSIIIPSCMIAWGTISVLTGITTNYTGIVVARFFLGFAEAPFFPGMIFLVSKWYKRDELALRIALVSCGNFLSSAFGSLLASAILHGMQDKLGQAAWRWLFFIEGGMTIVVAICAIFILPDFPHNTRWITPEERALAISRLANDGYGKADELGKQTTMQGLQDAVSDWKVWWFAVAAMFQIVGQSFFAYFPTLCATLGYDTTITLLLCAPPWVFAGIVAFILTWHSDKKQRRYKYFVIPNAFGALAFIVSIFTMNKAARYISLFLVAQTVTGYLVVLGWINNTFAREPAKRAVAIALVNAMGQIGNVIGSYAWPTNWGPTYRYSYAICIAALGVSTGMLGGMYLYLKHLNEQIERKERDVKDITEIREISFKYLV
ncbi:major facilitator superfamily domain-containing protein [Suillus subalutaceus]|uniref:major facilitator superfamily domain-containing protein n=1 Tax=Suillus subalutaceus TaxID=48586 RepID=UPI001B87B54D|nr:major facilitator superfamily domain-containing protein [Suillus subalutaceus]KAG1868263.1 major facilitator superfamily domain-containing protein [Suillus subalutaceus]